MVRGLFVVDGRTNWPYGLCQGFTTPPNVPSDAEIRQAKFDQIRRGSGQRKIVTPPPKLELPEAMHKRFPELRAVQEDYHRQMRDYFSEQLGLTFNE